MAGGKRIRKRDTWRERMIRTVARILDQGEPSKFAFEATCRHNIRHDLCLEGVLWAEADQRAASVVIAALDRIKAVRPTWDEGQLEHTRNFETDRTLRWTPAEFLSVAMEQAWIKRKARARNCDHCGTRYSPEKDGDAADSRFCSRSCKSAAEKVHQDRPCPVCGELFRPQSVGDGRTTQFCSSKCYGKARLFKPRPETTCPVCKSVFTTKRSQARKFCSVRCAAINARRAIGAKSEPPAEEEPMRRAAE